MLGNVSTNKERLFLAQIAYCDAKEREVILSLEESEAK